MELVSAMSKMKEKYLEEYKKYESVCIEPGVYKLKTNNSILFEVYDIDTPNEIAQIRTLQSGVTRYRTLHWCRKNLIRD